MQSAILNNLARLLVVVTITAAVDSPASNLVASTFSYARCLRSGMKRRQLKGSFTIWAARCAIATFTQLKETSIRKKVYHGQTQHLAHLLRMLEMESVAREKAERDADPLGPPEGGNAASVISDMRRNQCFQLQ
ncbi:hypothetical protein BJ742DRAFT_772558 [Cladochytrium replicatum]|nr:hypothetical protein BJ742DRAFT_772558 [Cladochytrium replicatum]